MLRTVPARRVAWSLTVVTLLLIGSLGLAQGQSGYPTMAISTPTTRPGPTAQEDFGCSLQIAGTDFDRNLYGTCTVSDPWWYSFSCAQTPIQGEPWKPAADLPVDTSFVWHPWLKLPSSHGEVVVTLWWGNRPIPAANASGVSPFGKFSISVTFPVPVRSVELVATTPQGGSSLKTAGEVYEYFHDARIWNVDEIRPPVAGCWSYTILATTEQGDKMNLPFTFVVTD
ncbi:MAG TPA: hypothetical protein VFQ54_02290 [Thermomicrobiales bacterium]|nr:hypothetical protein [Thermomicrobiales bacterium]